MKSCTTPVFTPSVMTDAQKQCYPTIARLHGLIGIDAHLHPFGFSVTDAGRPSLEIRIWDGSFKSSVPLEDIIQFFRETHARMLELGYSKQCGNDFPEDFIQFTKGRGCIWYWIPTHGGTV